MPPAPIFLPLAVVQLIPVADITIVVAFPPPSVIGAIFLIIPLMPILGVGIIIALHAICFVSLAALVLVIRSHDDRHRHYRPE